MIPSRVIDVSIEPGAMHFDPESKGGTEATVKIAKADLVPKEANLRGAYASFAELEAACEAFVSKVNGRIHRESARIPDEALAQERSRLHVLPTAPHTIALGQTRIVNTDQTVRFGSVRYSTPPGLVGAEVWVRVAGVELVVIADLDALPQVPDWAGSRCGLVEVARHRLSTPGTPSIDLAHYPDHPQDPDGAPRVPRPRAQPGRTRLPRPRRRRARLADRGLRCGSIPDPGEDGRRL